MIKLQQIEFEMLREFVRICDELNLTYFLVCGSALGAVKYKGFIPWDDDLDVALPRPDYEIFCREAQKMLPKHLFLQNYRTDSYYPLYMSKIRDSRTTFIEPLYRKINMHHGIYIDVFPLDGYPQSKKEIRKFEKKKVLYNRHRIVRYAYNRLARKHIRHATALLDVGLYKLFGAYSHTSRLHEKFAKLTASYWSEECEIWCNHGNWQGYLEYADKTQYGIGTWATFEGLRVRIPENYDAYLTQKYGNWKEDLPPEQKYAPHRALVMDLFQPYTVYIEQISDSKIRVKL